MTDTVHHEDRVLVEGVDVLPNVIEQQPKTHEDEGLQGYGDERVRRINAPVDDRNQERADLSFSLTRVTGLTSKLVTFSGIAKSGRPA